jgi:hypothetical protein
MPTRPQWLLRTPRILEEIAGLDRSVVDRSVIERTFGVRRRRAVQLMAAFGGYQAGNTILIERRRLLEQLEKIISSGEFLFEERRCERLTESLDQARQRRRAAAISIPIARTAARETLDHMPAGITLTPGLLRIEFEKSLELLEKLFQLAQAISNDFEQFEILLAGPR